jgi:very-short-patch-repair endonuclease
MANEIARSLRKRMTPQEVKLWVHLRSWRKRGFHFRRQSPRDDFIVDFVCLKQRLVIEVDGGSITSMHMRARTANAISTSPHKDLGC